MLHVKQITVFECTFLIGWAMAHVPTHVIIQITNFIIKKLWDWKLHCQRAFIIMINLQCVWLILSRKFSSSPAVWNLRVWRQASWAGGRVFTEVNWLKLRYILHIMIWYSLCSQKIYVNTFPWWVFVYHYCTVTERAKQLNSHTANRSLNKHGPHSESLAWSQTHGGDFPGGRQIFVTGWARRTVCYHDM